MQNLCFVVFLVAVNGSYTALPGWEISERISMATGLTRITVIDGLPLFSKCQGEVNSENPTLRKPKSFV